MFIDTVDIDVRSGSGGKGCVSFRREKYVPRGGPDGGDGGRGGDVIIRVDPQMRTLLDLRYRRSYAAGSGRPGEGARRTGKSADPLVIRVPPGTIVEDMESREILADLTDDSGEMVVARGGKGGSGNWRFRSAVDQAPGRATDGEEGEGRSLRLTLKLIADVGLVGLPNAGKSTLLRSVSRANPVVADYPFSTTEPYLGIVRVDETSTFCMVDIPGLIEGAHEGKGLGLEFLRHIERCLVLCFVLDAASEEVPPGDAYAQLLSEIGSYSPALLHRRRIVALNKSDLPGSVGGDSLCGLDGADEVVVISALERTGLSSLIGRLHRIVLETDDS
jgi:GTP-binding protein